MRLVQRYPIRQRRLSYRRPDTNFVAIRLLAPQQMRNKLSGNARRLPGSGCSRIPSRTGQAIPGPGENSGPPHTDGRNHDLFLSVRCGCIPQSSKAPDRKAFLSAGLCVEKKQGVQPPWRDTSGRNCLYLVRRLYPLLYLGR